MLHLSEEELTNIAARERNRPEPPLTNWDSLSAQLREEGIIRDPRAPRKSGNEWWLRAAAAIVLVAGGALAGRLTLTEKPQASVSQLSQATENSVPTFRTEEEAWDVLNRSGAEYQRASAFLAARDLNIPVDSTSVYQARLAALDGMTSASRKALYQAPHDPVINQYYLAAQGAREATLRQLGTSLPSGVKLVKW